MALAFGLSLGLPFAQQSSPTGPAPTPDQVVDDNTGEDVVDDNTGEDVVNA